MSDGRFSDDVVALVKRIRDNVRLPDRAPPGAGEDRHERPTRQGTLGSVELLIDGRSAGRFFPKPDRVAEFVVTPGSHTVQTRQDCVEEQRGDGPGRAGSHRAGGL